MVADSDSRIAWHRVQIRKNREAVKALEMPRFTMGEIGPKAASLTQLGRLGRPIGEFCEAPLRKSESDQRRADGGRRQNACSVDLLPCR